MGHLWLKRQWKVDIAHQMEIILASVTFAPQGDFGEAAAARLC
jgi:hypothetical protein